MNANRFLIFFGILLFPIFLFTNKCNALPADKTTNDASTATLEKNKNLLEGFKTAIEAAVGKITEASNKVDDAHTKADTALNAITPVKADVTTKLEALKAAANEAKAAKANRESAKTKLTEVTTKLTELKTVAATVDAQKQNLTQAETENAEGYTAAKEQLNLILEEQKKTATPNEETKNLSFVDADQEQDHAARKAKLVELKKKVADLIVEIDNAVITNTKKLNDIANKNIETYNKILTSNKDIFNIQGLVNEAESAVNEATQAVNEGSAGAGAGAGAGAAADGHLYVKNNMFNHEGLLSDNKKCSAEDKTKAACKANSNCYKIEGKPTCLCYPGFSPKEAQTSECVKNAGMTCQSGSHNCHANATCKLDNQLGIGCKCKAEFKGDGIFCSNSLKSMLSIIFVLAVASVQLLF